MRRQGSCTLYLSSSDIQAKLKQQMKKLQDRDAGSVEVSPEVRLTAYVLSHHTK